MENIKQFSAWRSEEIAKVILFNSGLVDLLVNHTGKFDFIAVSKKSPSKRIYIEVKATKYSRSEIPRIFLKVRNALVHYRMPVLMMYIDYDKEKGFYEVIKRKLQSEVKPIMINSFKEELTKLLK